MKILSIFFLLTIGCADSTTKLLPKPDSRLLEKKVTANFTYNNKVDILFVIDDSGSMDYHQRNLIQNLDVFVDEISKNRVLDYHIGVISSSADPYGWGSGKCDKGLLCGTRAKFIERSTIDGISILKENLRLGTGGSSTERFFDPVSMAFNPTNMAGANFGFYRQDAYLVIMVLTDAEDQSDMDADKFYNFLLGLKNGDSKKVLTYGAIIPSQDPFDCSRDDGSTLPVGLEKFFSLSSGYTYNLCDPKFGIELAKVSVDISNKIGKFIYLDGPPVLNSIVVKYGRQIIPNDFVNGWTFDPYLNAIVLGDDIEWEDQGLNVKLEVKFEEAKYPVPNLKKKKRKI